MQENEFENSIRKKLDELQFVPNEAVWKQVNDRIEKDKRKRRFVIVFWLMAFLLAGGGAIMYFSGIGDTNNDLLTRTDLTTPNIQNENKRDSATSETKVDTKKTDDHKIDRSSALERTALNKTRADGRTFRNTVSKSPSKTAIPAAGIAYNNEQASIEKQQDEPRTNTFNSSQSVTTEDTGTESATEKTIIDSAVKPLPEQEIKTASTDTSVSLATNNNVPASKKPANKKWTFGVSVFAGISDNISPIKILGNNSNMFADYSNAFPSQGTGGLNNSLSSLKLKYKRGFSFSLSATATKQLSKRFSFSTGVEYLYLSSVSKVGNKSTTQASIYDSTLNKSAEVKEYFGSGETVSFVNKYHLVQIPLSVNFQLNKSVLRPILFNIGLSPGWLVGSKALYANDKERMYYEEDEQLKKFVLSGQFGLQFTIANSSRYRFTAGPAIQYSFTNIAKPVIQSEQHLISAGIKTNITIK